MVHKGILKKMGAEHKDPVNYWLELETGILDVNKLLGQQIHLHHTGDKYCVKCGAKTNKLYGEGFCYHCFMTAPEADPCVIHPEKCQAHLGISRDMEWSKQNCLIDHFVYLAITDHLKVGVTRSTQVPKRWIDQGAIKAIKLARTPYRQLAGLIEVDLKQYYSDKTNWKKMLLGQIPQDIDLIEEKRKAIFKLAPQYRQYLEMDNTIYEFSYPILKIPQNIESINLDKTPDIKDTLVGIKGQYWIFESGLVINVRKFSGYFVEIEL